MTYERAGYKKSALRHLTQSESVVRDGVGNCNCACLDWTGTRLFDSLGGGMSAMRPAIRIRS
eukprot:6996750-Pyramimonas_sp.AAC.1